MEPDQREPAEPIESLESYITPDERRGSRSHDAHTRRRPRPGASAMHQLLPDALLWVQDLHTQFRTEDGGPGVHGAHWGDTKVACLQTYTNVGYDHDPQPEPPGRPVGVSSRQCRDYLRRELRGRALVSHRVGDLRAARTDREHIAGDDKGKVGKVLSVDDEKNRLIVEKVNFVKRHTKARKQGVQSGIVEREAPIHVSNVMLYDPKAGRGSRIGVRVLPDGARERVSKVSGETIPKGN